MSEIQKYNLSPAVQEILKSDAPELKIGDTFIKVNSSYSCCVYRVKGFIEDKKFIYVVYDEYTDWEMTQVEEKKTTFDQFKEYYLKNTKIPEGTTPQEWYDQAKKLIAGEIDLSQFEDEDSDSVNENNSLMHKNSKNALIAVQEQLEIKKHKAEVLKAFVSYEMERKRRELDKVKEKLNGVLAVFQKKIAKIMKVIQTIELYLGIDEELFQIQDGEKASADEPICFRQMILFMDEEIGYWKNGEGLDFRDVKWFDEWLVKDENYKKLIPEVKGMVVFRPRRYDREYKGYDPVSKAEMNKLNKMTYLLIRNGDCLYRVYTENITITGRLFPRRAELEELLQNLAGEVKGGMFYISGEHAKEQAENTIYQYKKRAILMQGLLDRTEIFNPISKQVSMFKLEEADGLIRFIYDDELSLPSGRLPFKEWKDQINEKIQHGSRVICTGYGYSKNYPERFLKYYSNEHNMPDTPSMDLYEVERYREKTTEWLEESEYQKIIDAGYEHRLIEKDDKKWRRIRNNTDHEDLSLAERAYDVAGYKVEYIKEKLSIMYDAGGEVWGGWGKGESERKNRVRFIIDKRDSVILNYDQISLEDLEFYLTSRVDRPNYLSMMPVLETLKQRRLEEMKSEQAFARLVVDRNRNTTLLHPEDLEKRVWESIDWWKFKNQWKRPIDKDDALALRMIEKRINSKNYENLKRLAD